jgi:hypothetical protein
MTKLRLCAQCGADIADRDPRALFCSRACKTASHNADLTRAASSPLLALLQTWRRGRHKTSGITAEMAAYAFREACALLDRFNAEDQAAGRRPAELVRRRLEQGWKATDSAPRAKFVLSPHPGSPAPRPDPRRVQRSAA